jgi:hypothetical protein
MIVVDFGFALIVVCLIITMGVLKYQKNETKADQVKRLSKENADLRNLLTNIDRAAQDEYTVSSSPFAGFVLDVIRRHHNKENK